MHKTVDQNTLVLDRPVHPADSRLKSNQERMNPFVAAAALFDGRLLSSRPSAASPEYQMLGGCTTGRAQE